MDFIQKSIQHIGIGISVCHSGKLKHGVGIVYPVRNRQKDTGNLVFSEQGRCDNPSFLLFAESPLLEGTEYGDIISDGSHQYMLLWTDNYSCRHGGYSKAGLKILTDGGDAH